MDQAFTKNGEEWFNTLGAYPLHDLEEEYDYETDQEQIYKAKKHNINENYLAIEFFTKEDPMVLVENLKPEHYNPNAQNE